MSLQWNPYKQNPQGLITKKAGLLELTWALGWIMGFGHSYDILGARMLWKPKEARILTNFIDQPV
jgi:hypothetical protein